MFEKLLVMLLTAESIGGESDRLKWVSGVDGVFLLLFLIFPIPHLSILSVIHLPQRSSIGGMQLEAAPLR